MFHNGVELMAVGGVSFGYFVKLAKDLKIRVAIVRDRDKKTRQYYETLYNISAGVDNVRVFLDENCSTLEPSFVEANKNRVQELSDAVRIKKEQRDSIDSLTNFMTANKTEWAFRLMRGTEQFEVPQYIKDAFCWIDGK